MRAYLQIVWGNLKSVGRTNPGKDVNGESKGESLEGVSDIYISFIFIMGNTRVILQKYTYIMYLYTYKCNTYYIYSPLAPNSTMINENPQTIIFT